MAEFSAQSIRAGTFLQVWLDGVPLTGCYKCSGKFSRNKQSVQLPGTLMEDHKVTSVKGTGSLGCYDYDGYLEDLIDAEIAAGVDTRHTLIVLNNDPDAPSERRKVLTGVSFDDTTLFDHETGQLGRHEFPFTFTGEENLDQ